MYWLWNCGVARSRFARLVGWLCMLCQGDEPQGGVKEGLGPYVRSLAAFLESSSTIKILVLSFEALMSFEARSTKLARKSPGQCESVAALTLLSEDGPVLP